MADELRIGLSELLRKAMIEQDAGFLKEGVRVLSQALMEMEVEEHMGAGRHERSPARTGQRNGYRQRDWDTRVGTAIAAIWVRHRLGKEPTVPRPTSDGGEAPAV